MSVHRFLRRTTAAVATVGVVAVLGSGGVAGAAPAAPAGGGAEAAGARYVVRYAPGTDMAAAARSMREDGVAVGRTFTHAIDGAVVTLTAAEAAALARSPGVLSVARDRLYHAADTQTNPTWGLDRIDQRTLPLSASFSTPAMVTPVDAYVLDTGTAPAHVDMTGRVRPGWSTVDAGPGNSDCNGHGTHVSGTIAGTTYGVAKTAVITPVRVLDCGGTGSLSQVIAGIDWVVGQHQPGTPAVANMSLGGPADNTLDAAVNALVADGVTVAVAAGNASFNACSFSPARVSAALTVAASDAADRQALFSNVGPCVDMYAPGVDITSDWITSPTATMTISGTSMSSPHVAGTAALLLSLEPTLAPAQVAQKLVDGATADVLTETTPGTANRLLYLEPPPPPPPPPPPATVPGQVGWVGAAARSHAARVRWVVATDGGSPITVQRIRVYRKGDKIRTVSVLPGHDHKRIKRLTPGRPYRFTVTLRNAVGPSPESAKSKVVRPRD